MKFGIFTMVPMWVLVHPRLTHIDKSHVNVHAHIDKIHVNAHGHIDKIHVNVHGHIDKIHLQQHTLVPERFRHKLNYFSFCLIFEKIFIITCCKFLIKTRNLQNFCWQVWTADPKFQELQCETNVPLHYKIFFVMFY
jgi:hypothetical protein